MTLDRNRMLGFRLLQDDDLPFEDRLEVLADKTGDKIPVVIEEENTTR